MHRDHVLSLLTTHSVWCFSFMVMLLMMMVTVAVTTFSAAMAAAMVAPWRTKRLVPVALLLLMALSVRAPAAMPSPGFVPASAPASALASAAA